MKQTKNEDSFDVGHALLCGVVVCSKEFFLSNEKFSFFLSLDGMVELLTSVSSARNNRQKINLKTKDLIF